MNCDGHGGVNQRSTLCCSSVVRPYFWQTLGEGDAAMKIHLWHICSLVYLFGSRMEWRNNWCLVSLPNCEENSHVLVETWTLAHRKQNVTLLLFLPWGMGWRMMLGICWELKGYISYFSHLCDQIPKQLKEKVYLDHSSMGYSLSWQKSHWSLEQEQEVAGHISPTVRMQRVLVSLLAFCYRTMEHEIEPPNQSESTLLR